MRLPLTAMLLAVLFVQGDASAQALPDALRDFTSACAIPRLEGKGTDFAALAGNYREAGPGEEAGSRTFETTFTGETHVLTVSANGACSIRYSVPAETPFGQEFVLALRALKQNYYNGQIGPPSLPGATTGFTAIDMRGPNASFDVVYSYKEIDGLRNIWVYTTRPR